MGRKKLYRHGLVRVSVSVDRETWGRFAARWESLGSRNHSRGVQRALEEFLSRSGVDPRAGAMPAGGGDATTLGLKVPEEIGTGLARYAKRTGKSVADLVRDGIARLIRGPLAREPEFAGVEEWKLMTLGDLDGEAVAG